MSIATGNLHQDATSISHDVATLHPNPRPVLTVLALLTGDLIGLCIGVVLGAAFAVVIGVVPLALSWHVLSVVMLAPLVFALADLYPGAGVSPVDEMRSIVLIVTTLALVSLLIEAFISGPVVSQVAQLVVLFFAVALGVNTSRILLREVCAPMPWWGERVLILGASKTAHQIIAGLRKKSNLNLKVVACLDDDPAKWDRELAGVPVTGPIRERLNLFRQGGVNYVIVAMPGMDPAGLASLVGTLGRVFSKVVVTPNAFGMTSAGVGTRDSGAVVGLYVRGHLSLRRNAVLKRAIDIALLVPLGVLAVPLLAIAVAVTMVISPGNPFYNQVRIGYQGNKMRLWKLRTMHLNAETLLNDYLNQNPTARAEWQTRFKLKDDPRIIPVVGNLFRRLSLDELPQLWNIAKGELSFVGPRPFPDYHLESFDVSFTDLRASVRPGLTGYWQVTSRATADLQGQVELDSYYISNWSPWLDLYVLSRTPWAVFFGRGAY